MKTKVFLYILFIMGTLQLEAPQSLAVSHFDAPIAKTNYLNHLATRAGSNATLKDIQVYNDQKEVLAKDYALSVWQDFLYQSKKIDSDFLALMKTDWVLQSALEPLVYPETFKYLRKFSSPQLQTFLNKAEDPSARSRYTVSLAHLEILEGRPAGYDQGQSKIIFDLEQLNPETWTLIFIHELSHAIDQVMADEITWAIDFRKTHINYVPTLQAYDTNITSPEDQILIRRWLQNTLNRGYFAEVRAWALTLSIYDDLRAKNLLKATPWMDKIWTGKTTNDHNYESAVDRVFSSRFADPDQGIYSNQNLRNLLIQVRAEMVQKL